MHSTRTQLAADISPDARSTVNRLNIPKRLGDYTLGRELGRGGMGVVFEAVEPNLDRKVAVKVLPNNERSDTAHKRFEMEARATAQLNHPNIVPLYHVGCDSGTHFYVMKLIDGVDLGRLIRDTKKINTKPSDSTTENKSRSDTQRALGSSTTHDSFAALVRERSSSGGPSDSAQRLAKAVAHVGVQAADALAHAHDCGIVHRDIKPANLLFDTSGNVWVADFGLAHFQNSPMLTHTGDLVGTLRYMSPEQASGRRDLVDHRTDIYSLGIALYELATLEHACRGKTAKDILREITFERPAPIRFHDPRLPKTLETIICKATERNPADRYQSANDLATDLKTFVEGGRLQTRRTPRWKHVRDWLYNRPALSTALVLLLFVSLISAAAGAVLINQRLTTSRAGELLSRSAQSLGNDSNPQKALELALASHSMQPSQEANSAILSALDELREYARFDISESGPGQLVFSPDGRQLLKCQAALNVKNELGEALVFDLQKNTPPSRLRHSFPIVAGAFSPNGRWMATSGYTANDDIAPPLVLWNASDFRRSPFVLNGTRALRVNQGNFTPAADRLVVPAKEQSEAIVFQIGAAPTEFARLRGVHTDLLVDSQFSPDGTRIITADIVGHVALWDAATGNHLCSTRIDTGAGTPNTVSRTFANGVMKTSVGAPISGRAFVRGSHIEFSRDSSKLLVGGFAGTQIYDSETLEKLAYVRQPDSHFSHSGSQIVCRDILRTQLLSYDVHSGELTSSVGSSGHSWNSFTLVGQGEIVCCYDLATPSMQLVDLATGKTIAELASHTDLVEDVEVRPGSDQFASCSWDGTLRLWNIRTESQQRTVAFDFQGGLPVTLSNDGELVVVGSRRVARSTQFSLDDNDALPRPALTLQDSMEGFVVGGLGHGHVLTYHSGELKRLDAISHRIQAQQFLAPERTSVAVVASGEHSAVMVIQPGRLVNWDFDTNRLQDLVRAKVDASACAAIPTDPSLLLIGTRNGKLLAFDLDTNATTELLSVQGGLNNIDIAHDGKTAVFVREGFDIMLLDIESGQIVGRFPSPDRLIACKFLDNQHVLLQPQQGTGAIRILRRPAMQAPGRTADDAGSNDATGPTIDVPTLDEVAVLESSAQDFCISSDSQNVFVATLQGIVKWDWQQGEQQPLSSSPTTSVQAFGDFLVAAVEQPGGSSELQVIETTTHQVVAQQSLSIEKPRVRVDKTNGFLWVSGSAFVTDTFEVANPQSRSSARESSSPVIGAWAFDNDELLTVTQAGEIRVGKLSSDQSQLVGQHPSRILTAQITPDRHQLLTSDEDGITRQWDIPSRSLIRNLDVTGSHSIGSDNLTVISSIGADKLGIWDLRSGEVSVEEFEHPIIARSLSTEDGTVLIVTGKVASSVRSAKYVGGLKGMNQVYRLNLQTRKRQIIEDDKTIVDCLHLPNGDIALLDVLGRVRVKSKDNESFRELTLNENIVRLHRRVVDNKLFAHTATSMIGWDLESGKRSMTIPLAGQLGTQRLQFVGNSADWLVFASSSGIYRVPRAPATYAAEIIQ